MSNIGSDVVIYTFLLFCRIGACLMFMPGFSSPRVPTQVRIFIAISVTLALAPLLVPGIKAAVPEFGPLTGLQVLIAEIFKGALIGLLGRFFFLALEFTATLGATAVGFANMPGIPVEEREPAPAFSTLITMTATVLFFLADQHWEVMRGLMASYRALPVSADLATQLNLIQLTDILAKSFVMALQIGSPFVIYSLGINILFGITNKLTPQIGVYFVSLPFVVLGGMVVLYFVVGELLKIFIGSFGDWLRTG